MTETELLQLRRQKWRLDGRAMHTPEEAREFIESAGFCLMYPLRKPMLVPTFIGAYVGDDNRLPTCQHAFADPRAKEATELMVRLLRERAAYEAPFGDTNLLVSASAFPFFYGLVGDRNPRQASKPGARSEYSQLARDAFEVIRRHGKISKQKLLEDLRGVSAPALDRALGELWSRLRIIRVDYNPQEGAFWDELFRWSPEAVREGIEMSLAQALSALISKYLDCVIAADRQEIAEFFSHFVSRSKVSEAINALLAARELSFVTVDSRSHIQVTPPKVAPAIRVPHRREPVDRKG